MLATTCDITSADKALYNEQGFWFSPATLIDPEQLDAIVQAQDRVNVGEYDTGEAPADIYWRPSDDPNRLRKIDNSFLSSQAIGRFVKNSIIGRIAAQLLGTSAVRLWHDQLTYKPTGGALEANVAWHQDYNYWQCCDRPNLITAWIPLQDVDAHSGTIHLLKGSHAWGWKKQFSPSYIRDLPGQRHEIEQHMPGGATFEPVPAAFKAGHVSFHHCLTIHGSGANLSQRPRRIFVMHLQADDCRYRSAGDAADQHPCARQMRSLGKTYGDAFEGRYWPALWPADAT